MLKKYSNYQYHLVFMKFVYACFVVVMFGLIYPACTTKSSVESNTSLTSTEEVSESTILLEDLSGNTIDLEDFEGKVIVLNFWATWCKPCIAEMPSIDRLSKKLDSDRYVILAASDERFEKIEKFVEKYPYNFKYVHLKTNVYELDVSVLPTTFIIDDRGEIIEKIIGAREWDSSEMIEKLQDI